MHHGVGCGQGHVERTIVVQRLASDGDDSVVRGQSPQANPEMTREEAVGSRNRDLHQVRVRVGSTASGTFRPARANSERISGRVRSNACNLSTSSCSAEAES